MLSSELPKQTSNLSVPHVHLQQTRTLVLMYFLYILLYVIPLECVEITSFSGVIYLHYIHLADLFFPKQLVFLKDITDMWTEGARD